MYDRILIVDDHPDNLEILEDVLGDDYEISTAASGEEALELAETFRPALILLDIMMPGIDGYETCRRLRATPSLRHTKIMMISAKAMVTERLQGYEAGADDYMTKPFDLEELREKVQVYLRLRSLEELDALKSDVLSLLSHETATPLNGLLGPIQILRDDPEMELAERIQLLDLVYDSAMRLHMLYNKVCKLSAMRAGQWRFMKESVTLEEIIQAALSTVAPQANKHQIEVKCVDTAHCTVEVDTFRMQEAIVALLDNAIQVSPAAGCITVHTWQEANRIRISVHDQGPGSNSR
ncbi:MAG: hypothetical protein ETSY2_43500, partial [Candidatus Entotheonella gemina]